ncbi:MAG: hypothetical protein U0K65_07980, partial [Negativibacillus sp.]|nr:hypothetical protein [Negativibacillus sp.]
EEPQTPEQTPTEETPSEGIHDDYDRENPDGVVNEGPAQVPIQNEDVQPSFTEQKSDEPQEEHTGRRPAASTQSKEDESTKSETTEQEEPSDTTKSDTSEKPKDGPLFSTRRPAK